MPSRIRPIMPSPTMTSGPQPRAVTESPKRTPSVVFMGIEMTREPRNPMTSARCFIPMRSSISQHSPTEATGPRRLDGVADRFHNLSAPSPGLQGLHARSITIQNSAHTLPLVLAGVDLDAASILFAGARPTERFPSDEVALAGRDPPSPSPSRSSNLRVAWSHPERLSASL